MSNDGSQQEGQRDQLIRAYIDGELTPQARATVDQRRTEDAEFRAALENAQMLTRHLGSLPSPEPPSALGDQIMRAVLTAEERTSWFSWLTRPIPVPAWGLALVLVACASALWITFDGSEPHRLLPPATQRATLTNADVACPAPHAVPVRFLLHAPRAAQVSLVGDFNAWKAQDHLMADTNGNGVWTVTVPMQPGRYQYKFVVDGKWIADPDASSYTFDGFGDKNAVISL